MVIGLFFILGLFFVQPIADRVEQNLEITGKTFSTNQNSAQEIYD